jgi:F0F1-type ATP synthase membrane subunit b/b'
LATSEANSPTTAKSGYPNTPIKQYSYIYIHIMKMIEDFKNDIKNSLKEIQQNTSKQVEVFKEEMHKTLKEVQENAIKQVKELNKTIQDLKLEVESLKKTQRETALEKENLGKKNRSHRCKHHQQNIGVRL